MVNKLKNSPIANYSKLAGVKLERVLQPIRTRGANAEPSATVLITDLLLFNG
jgi:hypothetical protein